MPTFVVPVDFSEKAHKMLDIAIRHATEYSAKVVLVHAFQPGIQLGSIYTDGALDPIRDLQAELQMDEAIELTTKWAAPFREAGLEVEPVAQEGKPGQTIVDIAKSHQADMIVIGRAGRGALGEFFFGSTADHVVRHSPVPVLVVPYK